MEMCIPMLLTILITLHSLTTLATKPNSSDILRITTPQIFNVIVPNELSVRMDKFGVITTAEDVAITNTSKDQIVTPNIAVDIKDSKLLIKPLTINK